MIQIDQLIREDDRCQVRLTCSCGDPALALYTSDDEQILFCTRCGAISTRESLLNESSVPHIAGPIHWLDLTDRAECPMVNASLAVTIHAHQDLDITRPLELKGTVTKISADKCFLRLEMRGAVAALQRQQEIDLQGGAPPLEERLPGIVEDVVWPYGPQNPAYYKVRLIPISLEQKTHLEEHFQATCGLQFDSRVLMLMPPDAFRGLRRMMRQRLPKARIVVAASEADFLRLLKEFEPGYCLLPPESHLLDAIGLRRYAPPPDSPRVILLLQERSQDALREALLWGAGDVLFPDCGPEQISRAIERCRQTGAAEPPPPPAVVSADDTRIGGRAPSDTVALQQVRQRASISDEDVVRTLCMASETHDPHSSNHLNRISAYTAAIARRLGLSRERIAVLATASKLHDVGKMGVPDEILRKTGALTADERQVMQEHTRFGYRILQASGGELMRLGAMIALRHHERYDGQGYPDGHAGEAIPIEARIVTVADVFDALTTQRAYKPAWPNDKAIEFLLEQAGRMFDPAVVEAFLHVTHEIEATQLRFMDDFRDIWTERRIAPRIPTPPVPLRLEIVMPELTFRPRELTGEIQNISQGGVKVLLNDVSQDLFTTIVSMRRYARILCADGPWRALDQTSCAVSWLDYYAVPSPSECLIGLNFQKDPPGLTQLIEALPQ